VFKASVRRSLYLVLVLTVFFDSSVFAAIQSKGIADQKNVSSMLDGIGGTSASALPAPAAVAPVATLAKNDSQNIALPTPGDSEQADDSGTVRAVSFVNPAVKKDRKFQVTGACAWLTQPEAIEWMITKHFKERVAYNISVKSSEGQLPGNVYYCANLNSHVIAVAKSQGDAEALSYDKPRVFYAVQNENLSTTLTRWAAESGYHLNWMSQHDYTIQFPYTFYGNLTADHGTLEQILATFGGASFPLKAEVTENRVILIEDNEYSPSIVNID